MRRCIVHNNSKIILNTFLIISSILFFNNSFLAQQNEILFKEITTKEGLLDDVAIAIEQDRNGYMWFGTRSGLVRYDGIKLKNYTYNPDLPDGLSGNNIVGLHIDNKETLWIGTINGLCRFDEKLDRPVKIIVKINDVIIHPYIQDITSSNDGIIWFATLNNGLISYNPQSNIFVQYLNDKNKPNSILSNRVFSVYCSSGEIIWIGTDNGLNSYDQKNNLFSAYIHKEGNPKTISGNNIISIEEGDNGDIYIGTSQSGLNILTPKTKDIRIYKYDANNNNSLNDDYISSITYDDGKVWIGSGRGEEVLNRLDPDTGIIERFKISGQNKRIFGSSINDICIDRTGIIWIAHGLNGIKYFDSSWKNYKQYLIDNSGDENLLNRVYGINPVSNTKIWASTFEGLVLFDLKTGVQKVIRDNQDIMLLNSNSIFVNEELWIPSREKGIVRYNLETNKLSYFKNNLNDKHSLSSNYVNFIIKDCKNIVWAGSRDGGLDRIDPKSGQIKRINFTLGEKKKSRENSVYALLEKNNEELWVGTNGGLVLLNKNDESFIKYSYDPNDSLTISSDQISYILLSSQGVLWIATYGGGLNKFDHEKKIFKRYTSQKNNIPDNTIYSLIEDDQGNFWVSTAGGVARFSPAADSYDYLIPLPDNYKVNKFPNGNIIFSGPRGLVIFDPNKIEINTNPPSISLADFNVNGEKSLEGKADSLRYILEKEGSIELDYFQNDISLNFVAAHYSNPNKNKYQVLLEGYDNDWRSLGNNRYINYTNLDPGKYILKAKAASAYSVWTNKPLEYTVIIRKPWWKTNIAYLTYLFIVVGFLYSIRKIELNRQKKNAEIQESLLRAEAAELQAKVVQAENDRKTKELEEARQLQLSMLPKELPKIDNLEIAAYMQTATEVGGDYYDFAVKDDGSLNVCLGDATGHGMKAGTLVSMMKSLFIADSIRLNITEFFNSSNVALKKMSLEKMMMAFTMLNIDKRKIQMSNAGIPPILIYRNQEKKIEEINLTGMPLGAMRNTNYRAIECELTRGDSLLMMSDGMPELQNTKNEMYGYERLISTFKDIAEKSPIEIIELLKAEISNWTIGNEPDDDVTFVVIKVR